MQPFEFSNFLHCGALEILGFTGVAEILTGGRMAIGNGVTTPGAGAGVEVVVVVV